MGLKLSTHSSGHAGKGYPTTGQEHLTMTTITEDNVSRPKELKRVLNDVKKRGIKWIRVEITDINGMACCKMVAVHSLKELGSKLERGFSFPPACIILGHSGIFYESAFKVKYMFSDVCALPDLGSFRMIPWLEDTATFSTVLYHINRKDLVVEHPRNEAIQQLQRLKSLGLSLMSACELEFRLCDTRGQDLFEKGTRIYCSTKILIKANDYIKKLFECLKQAGVPVDGIHAEHLPGSLELIMKPSFGIKTADDVIMCKNACKEIALCNGYTAQFIPNPSGTGNGCTIHFNHSIWDKSGNVVSNLATGDLTDVGKHWIAGLLAHSRGLTPLLAPTVSGIKMFADYDNPDRCEPSYVSWGRHNRSVTFRVKNADGPNGSYVENRIGRIDADPYIMLAGTIAAGLDGIMNKLPLPEECKGNAHKDMPNNATKIPCDMEEGIAALVQDKALCDALGQEFIDLIVAVRRHEIEYCNEKET
ncbi:lengsin-like [Lytechinus variegatus]|uniref:lengsin-like n=1 Tax=Lytechinus variegatus TaxID=7654 RepID=UPI001BB1D27D|nr:lengsin-like [Lytechinus variegatus]